MLVEIVIALILGIIAGVFTGLTPGLHINLVGAFLISSAAISSYNIEFIVFIVAMSITHTFLDFIPSVFIGAPEEETSLSVLPGHDLLKKGRGHEAVYYTAIGGLAGILIILLFTPIFLFILPKIEIYLKNVMFLILITASLFLIFKKRIFWSGVTFLLAGFLGIAGLNLGIREPLLPLFSGLFGIPSILLSIKNRIRIPKQKIRKSHINFKAVKRPFLATILASPLCSFLPSLGSSQAAVIGSDLVGKASKREFLFLIGSINTIVVGLSFITLLSIGKSRTGVASFLKPAVEIISFNYLIAVILLVIILSGLLSFFLTLKISKLIASKINSINYTYISIVTLLFILTLTLFISGFLGIMVLVVSTSLGLFAVSINVSRSHLLGCLMLPTILFYLPSFS
ncbi:tripartite tricarboxylate transporter permease [Candidatus Pacearchaeota archaeon]|nr:tripartite tricarboxylate transporter permease [Candidatus Pacearchaeota archaeon]